MNNFEALGLPETMLPALEAINFTIPTPIQAQAIPVAMEGYDILGSAQTGTGKTGAFAIPMIAHLLACPASSALILLPTRELADRFWTLPTKCSATGRKFCRLCLSEAIP